ncbi:MAG: hypothetical protein LUO86_03130 [Methanomicrobiales archaeon]|nr:hypothetical protein [Methanomicrobiales archaeon]
MRFGEYPILVENPTDTRYIGVALQVTLPPGEPVERLIALYRKNDAQFNYEILRNFSSPVTGFSRIFDWGEGGGLHGLPVPLSLPSEFLYPEPGRGTAGRRLCRVGRCCVLKDAPREWETEKELAKIEPGPMYE